MIISFNGDEGSGKSTVAKKIAQALHLPHYYMGQIFRDMAQKRGLTLVEYLKLGESDPSVDKEVDNYLINLSQKEKDFVIESRTAWHLIPNSLKIYLAVTEEEGAKRIFLELQKENNRNELNEIPTVEKVLEKIRERRKTDDIRYLKYYGIDIRQKNNYDFILDTTQLTIDEAFEKTLSFIQKKKDPSV